MPELSRKFIFQGFASYKDGSFRIVFRDSRKQINVSMPLNKTDRLNWRSNMKKADLQKLIEKYAKKFK